MRERPILFSAAMVRAILEGRKTQTRRVVKRCGLWESTGGDGMRPMPEACPYGQPGDRLWVRETWGTGGYFPYPYAYRADGVEYPNERWKPSIHMPRAACRLVLEITDMRVERLQAISEADAAAEGAEHATEPCDHVRRSCAEVGCLGPTHRAGFADLWASINGQASWDANPWVWVVEFRRVEG